MLKSTMDIHPQRLNITTPPAGLPRRNVPKTRDYPHSLRRGRDQYRIHVEELPGVLKTTNRNHSIFPDPVFKQRSAELDKFCPRLLPTLFIQDILYPEIYSPMTTPVNSERMVEDLLAYRNWDCINVIPFRWMSALVVLKTGIALGLIESDRIKEAVDEFDIEYEPKVINRSRASRERSAERLANAIAEEGLSISLRKLLPKLKDIDGETREQAILFLLHGLVLSDYLDISELNPFQAQDLRDTLQEFVEGSDIQDPEVLAEAMTDAKEYEGKKMHLWANRVLKEINRVHFAEGYKVKEDLVGHDKFLIAAAMVMIYAETDDATAVNMFLYNCLDKLSSDFECLLGAIFLYEVGADDLAQQLLVDGYERHVVTNFHFLKGARDEDTDESPFLSCVIHNEFFENIARRDNGFAWDLFEHLLVSSGIYALENGSQPRDWCAEGENFFDHVSAAFTPDIMDRFAHHVLFSERTTNAWKKEVLDYYGILPDPEVIGQDIELFIANNVLKALTDEDVFKNVRMAMDLALTWTDPIADTQDAVGDTGLTLIPEEQERDPDESFFTDLIRIGVSPDQTLSLAKSALDCQAPINLKEQAYYVVTALASDDEKEVYIKAQISNLLTEALYDETAHKLVLQAMEDLVKMNPFRAQKFLSGVQRQVLRAKREDRTASSLFARSLAGKIDTLLA